MSALARALLLAGLAAAAPACAFDDVPCQIPVETIFDGCPTTFDGTETDLPRCGAMGGLVAARACGGLNELTASTALPGRACVYDATTHRLIGARILPGEPTACGPRAPTQTWGRQVDQACKDAPPTVMRDCGPAGTAGHPG